VDEGFDLVLEVVLARYFDNLMTLFLTEVGATFGKGVFDVDFATIALEVFVDCKKVWYLRCCRHHLLIL